MSGVVGYSLKGVGVEVTNAFKADSLKSIKSSRIAQGEKHISTRARRRGGTS
jgi:hypothetical protein